RHIMLVHVAERHNVLAFQVRQVVRPLAADTDGRQVKLLVGRNRPAQAEHPPGHNHKRRGREDGATQELAAAQRALLKLGGSLHVSSTARQASKHRFAVSSSDNRLPSCSMSKYSTPPTDSAAASSSFQGVTPSPNRTR